MINETLEADRAYQRDKHDAYEQGYNDGYEQGVKDAREQPKQRTGKWIPKDGRYHCDQCSGIAPKGIRWDFCPNCGAKMTKGVAE